MTRVDVTLSRAAADQLRNGGSLVVELRLPCDSSAVIAEKVAGYLEAHPGAGANEVYREVGAGHRRADVLAAVLRVRAAEADGSPVQNGARSQRPVPEPGTGTRGGGS